MTNPLAQLPKAGQSVWYDQTDRRLIATGKLPMVKRVGERYVVSRAKLVTFFLEDAA